MLYTHHQAEESTPEGKRLPTVAELQSMTGLDPEQAYWSSETCDFNGTEGAMCVQGTGDAFCNSLGSVLPVVYVDV